jgi:hypothetical protein
METFPTAVIPGYPYSIKATWKTRVTDFEGGKEQRRQVWAFPKRTVTIACPVITQDQMKVLWQFYQQCKGAYEVFWYIDKIKEYWYAEYVAVGDGAIEVFDIPGKECNQASIKVYVDAEELLEGWDFISGGGQAGADRISFDSGYIPELGQVVTVDFYGYLRLRVRFAEDKLERNIFALTLYNGQMMLSEARE